MPRSLYTSHGLLALAVTLLGAGCGDAVTAPSALPTIDALFTYTGSASSGRSAHVAALLPDGRALVAGGINGLTWLRTAEVFDPRTGTWTTTAGMEFPRAGHAVARLADGRVLVFGGGSLSNTCADPPVANSAELYDAVTGTWTRTGNLNVARSAAIAVRLADGRVLAAGGGNRCGIVRNSVEIYDPATGTWTPTGSLNVARQSPSGVLLPDGRVLVAGGIGGFPFPSLASAEIYDPATGQWALTGAMQDPRMWTYEDMGAAGFLVVLADGKVLTAGGLNRCSAFNCDLAFLGTAELFDPASGTWTRVGSLAEGRFRHQMAPLPGGRVLVAGGRAGGAIIGSAEVYDPADGTWTAAGSLNTARYDYTATSLSDGRVLLAEGIGPGGTLASAELFMANQAPVARLTQSTVSGLEGSELAFDAGGSTDPDGDALSFAWDFGDGSPGATGAVATHTYADDGTYVATVSVSDGLVTSTAAAIVTVANVAPLVSELPAAMFLPGGTYSATGSFSDPGADAWTATVDYGDGSGPQALALSGWDFALAHVYSTPGTYTVVVTVSDEDGGAGVARGTVQVLTWEEAVGLLVDDVKVLSESGTLSSGNIVGLEAKLRAALQKLADGNLNAAANELQAFVNQLNSLVQTGRLTPEEADPLIELAEQLIAALRA